MHQYKTVTQILLILSIFNLVFATPVVREIYDAHDDVVVPVVVRNAAAMLKERGQPESDDTPLPSSPPPLDGSAPSHSLPPPSDGSIPLHDLSLSDGPAPLRESSSPPGGPAALAVSSPPGGTATLPIVLASDPPVQVHSTSTSQPHRGVTHDMLTMDHPSPEAQMESIDRFGILARVVIAGGVILAITGGLLWYNRHHGEQRRRTIDPDCSTAIKGSWHPCPDH